MIHVTIDLASPAELTQLAAALGSIDSDGKPGNVRDLSRHCAVHQTPMRKSTKNNGYHCPRRNDDGTYCNSEAA